MSGEATQPAPGPSAGRQIAEATEAAFERIRLDTAATEDVLRRAFEIAHVAPSDSAFQIGRETLVEIANEVDLPPSALAAAVAERMLGIDEADGLLDRLVGPAQITATRFTNATEDAAADRMVQWLESGHGLRTRIRADGVVVGTKRDDLLGKVGRTMRSAQGQGGLGKQREVTGAAVDLDHKAGGGAVSLAVDISGKRNEALLGGGAVAVGTGVVVGGVSLLAGPLVLIGLPIAAGAGVLTSRILHGSNVRKVTHDVEETIDGVAVGTQPKSMLGGVTKQLSRRMRRR